MKIKIDISLFLLSVVILCAFVIRVYNISNIPPGFFADEASIGYNAYSILTKGKDEGGNKFPILFQNFDTFYRPGLSVYLSVPFVALFGLNEFSLRLAAAFFGTLSIVFAFGIARLLFFSKMIALLTAFFLTISPWHIHFSRINQEFIYFVCFLTLSILLFLLAVGKKHNRYLIVSFFSFGLTLYTYVPAYFLVPIFIFLLTIIYRKNLLRFYRSFIVGLGIFSLLAVPLFIGLGNGKTLSRYNQVSNATKGKEITEVAKGMILTYRDHFMPEFLFVKGDIGVSSHFITRFSVRGMGQLYWFQLPLILLGIIYAFRHKKSFLVILGWLLLYPLGSTAAPFADGGGPFATRSIMGAIPFQLVSAAGIYFAFSLVKNHPAKLLLVLLFTIIISSSFKDYVYRYFVEYQTYAADFWGWQYGPRDIMGYFKEHKNEYDELLFPSSFNSPDIFVKFYDPENVCGVKCRVGDLDRINPSRNQLFAIPTDRIPLKEQNALDIKRTIYYPNGLPAFFIGEFH